MELVSITMLAAELLFRPFSPTLGITDHSVMMADVASAHVVFVGELHGDVPIHQFQLTVLESVGATHSRVLLAMEQFERDTQAVVDSYLEGKIDRDTFKAKSRAWGNYDSSYAPLVDFAKSKSLPVLAANVPRPIAAQVNKSGLDSLSKLPANERLWAAETISPLPDEYRIHFEDYMKPIMASHGGADVNSAPIKAMIAQLTLASLVKDETMAESVANFLTEKKWLTDNESYAVVFTCGVFHSEKGIAIPQLLLRRLPQLKDKIRVITPIVIPRDGKVDISQYYSRPSWEWIVFFPEQPKEKGK